MIPPTRQRRTPRLRCCDASACRHAGGTQLRQALLSARRAAGADPRSLAIEPVGCLRLCGGGPLVACDSRRGPHLWGGVPPSLAPALVAWALAGASPPATAAEEAAATLAPHALDRAHPFFRLQRPVVLARCGWVQPDSLTSALALGAYRPLRHCLHHLSPEQVRAEIRRSGLRGRGGAGYPTGLKWDTVALQPPGPRVVVANADEGDPGAFMDRTVLESDPHAVLEGLAIAAWAVGAERGFVYVRAEYPLAIERLRRALAQVEGRGGFGAGLCQSPWPFRLAVRVGAGAYVCGEETALLASLGGGRGTPRPRPPYPAQRGVDNQPTLINNVETLAAIPAILRRGGAWYASLGTAASAGTKVLSISGQVARTGVVEVPLGMTVHTLVHTMAGGGLDGAAVKAVQTGGPTGGCLPASLFHTPLDYGPLAEQGSMLGSGGLVVLGPSTSLPALAHHFMGFCAVESCGKCVPCRAGTRQLQDLLARFVAGEAEEADRERLEELCTMVRTTSLCGLGQGAPNPVLSSLRHFGHEYRTNGR